MIARWLVVLVLLFPAALIRAEDSPSHERVGAGPPLLGDDPDTPGPGRWELNLAVAAQLYPSEGKVQAFLPLLDINYGLGERIQLKYEVPWVVQSTDSGGLSGVGGSLAGLKWRFLDDQKSGVALSIYPQIELAPFSESFSESTGINGPNLLLPVQASKLFANSFTLGAQGGFILNSRTHLNEILYGMTGGYPVSEQTELLAEIFTESRADFSEHQLIANLGSRLRLSDHLKLMLSAGRGVYDTTREGPRWIGYFGAQITL